MKRKSAVMLLLLAALCISAGACKKEKEKPATNAATDYVVMTPGQTSVTVNVLENDTYSGPTTVYAQGPYANAGVSVSNNQVTYTPKLNFYGTDTIVYDILDDNGISKGNLIVKSGTDAQIRTVQILQSYMPELITSAPVFLFLYAKDGDTSAVYKNGYAGKYFWYDFNRKLKIYSGNVMPDIGTYAYSITPQGDILTSANVDNTPVIFQVLDYFTATAKRRDGAGTVTVHGLTIKFNGHVLDYTTLIP